MNILGINGLGIAPSACVVRDGALIALAEEERFNRLKGSFGLLPVNAARFCLEYAGLRLDEIDSIAFAWDCNAYVFYMPYFFLRTYIRYSPKFHGVFNINKGLEQLVKYHPRAVMRRLRDLCEETGLTGKMPPVIFVPHHWAHAMCGYCISGFDRAHIIVIDGSGEDRCTTIMEGRGTDVRVVRDFKAPNSLGWFYQSVTEFLGFTPNRHEGKVMALAAYGERDSGIAEKMDKILSSSRGSYLYNARYGLLGRHSNGNVYSDEMERLFGPARRPSHAITQTHKNIAYHAQALLEKASHNLVAGVCSGPGASGRVCISGGVGLNCKMNGSIAGMDCVQELSVSPFPHDAGTALGAALYVAWRKGFPVRFTMEHSYWGPCFSSAKIEQALIQFGAKYRKEAEIERVTAGLIAQDKIVGWFQGRMEAGQRALGNRSILANPVDPRIAAAVNKKAKNRELWRPFAPSLLYENRFDFIESSRPAPFMSIAVRVSDEVKKKIPAVVHVDNTTRPQYVKKDINPRYWKVIDEFRKMTGIAAVLNTSFNADEEPVVCAPEDALRTFYASGMDYLAIDDFLVYK